MKCVLAMKNDKHPDLFSAHEVLHTASIIAVFFENTIERHSFTQSEPTIRAAAEGLSAQLHDFYQLVGRVNAAARSNDGHS
jgi:hypothetical protein